ncbi:MAG: hypothetical protein LBN10_03715 [Propionibacteriaceae bacterium]|jgi:hypothetical protein|nr:hypothetical protein [Propionibacteriaceae bacterium]
MSATATAPKPKTPSAKSASVSTTPGTPKASSVPGAKASGPQFFRLVRLWLLIVTLVCTAFGVVCVVVSESAQESSAQAAAYSQDLEDLHSTLAQAHADALLHFAGAGTMDSYADATSQADSLLAGLAHDSPSDAQDLVSLFTAVRQWSTQVGVDAQSRTPNSGQASQTAYETVDETLTRLIDATSPNRDSGLTILVLGLVGLGVGALCLLAGLILTALRSHRVINVGLALALLATIGSIVTVGLYSANTTAISSSDETASRVVQASYHAWTALQQDCLSIIDPTNAASHLELAAKEVSTALGIVPDRDAAVYEVASQLSGLDAYNESIASASAGDDRRVAVSDKAVFWTDFQAIVDTTVDGIRPDPKSLVVNSVPYIVALVACGLTGVACVLYGVHVRAKEYL